MRTDFDRQWERRKAWRGRCPLDDADLRRRVLRAQTLGENSPLITHHSPLITRLWLPAAAAACLLAVLLPISIKMSQQQNQCVRHVNVSDCDFFFACNKGCSAETMIVMFNTTFE